MTLDGNRREPIRKRSSERLDASQTRLVLLFMVAVAAAGGAKWLLV